MIAFAAPQNNEFTTLQLPYLPTRSFVRLSWRYTLAVIGTLVLSKNCIDLNQFLVLQLHNTFEQVKVLLKTLNYSFNTPI